MKHRILPPALRMLGLLLLMALAGCQFGSDPTAGGGGGTEGQGFSLSGRLVTASGSPLAGAKVKLYAADTSVAKHRAAKRAADAVAPAEAESVLTNSNGRFTFKNVERGTYDLMATSRRGDTLLSLFIHNLVVDEDTDLGTNTVPVSGSLFLEVRAADGALVAGALCQVTGIPVTDLSDAQGLCVLSGVPPGIVTVTVTHASLPGGRSANITVQSGGFTNGGSVKMTGIEESPGDSLPFTATASTVALWTFDAYEDGLIRDQKNAYHLTPSSLSALPLASSPHGSAVTFAGSAKRFSRAYTDSFNVGSTGRLTYEARIFMTQYPAASNWKSRVALVGMYAGIQMQVHNDGSLYMKAQKMTPSATWYDTLHTAPNTVPLNRWVNVALAVDTTVSPDQVYAYIDGVPVQMYGTATDNAFRIFSAPFTIGDDSQDDQTFNGRIDEVRVSNALVLGAGLPLRATPQTPPAGTAAGLQASQDTHVWGPSPAGSAIANTNDNQGKAAYFCIGAYDVSTVHRGLVQFVIPQGTTSAGITKATLVLHARNWLSKNVHAGNFRIDAHRLLKDWKEGTGAALDTKNSAAVDGATGRERFWGAQNGSEDWSGLFIGIDGTDATAAPAGTSTQAVGYMGAWEIDVTALAKFWADNPAQNFGMVLTTDMPLSDPQVVDLPHFHAREAAVADSLKPRLVLQ